MWYLAKGFKDLGWLSNNSQPYFFPREARKDEDFAFWGN